MAKGPKSEDTTGSTLAEAVKAIDGQFGKGTVVQLGNQEIQKVDVIPTGSLLLDRALGVGGLPRGRVVEIFGPESSGKTSLALHVMANAQRAGGKVAIIDAEHALDTQYARNLGVDVGELYVCQPQSAEQGLQVAEMLVRTGQLTAIVIDSVAALVPRAEIEGEMGDSHVGLLARLMGQGLRKLTPQLAAVGTTAIFINQIREKVGVIYGSPETTPGGRALKFFSSVRLDIRRVSTNKEGTTSTGNKTRVKVVKNKMAPPFTQAEFDIEFGRGISLAGEVVDLGTEMGVLNKRGHAIYDGEMKLGAGRGSAVDFLYDNPELLFELADKVKKGLGF